jgi:hypothetical protein
MGLKVGLDGQGLSAIGTDFPYPGLLSQILHGQMGLCRMSECPNLLGTKAEECLEGY